MNKNTMDLQELVPSEHLRLVAAEPGRNGDAKLFIRDADGRMSTASVPFEPWLLVDGQNLAASVPGQSRLKPLEGDGVHNVQVRLYPACNEQLAARCLSEGTYETVGFRAFHILEIIKKKQYSRPVHDRGQLPRESGSRHEPDAASFAYLPGNL